jgi:hypothetical protein
MSELKEHYEAHDSGAVLDLTFAKREPAAAPERMSNPPHQQYCIHFLPLQL